ncbi:16S rRNA (cytosine(1402)-N(4))-methyltransferase RsmH [Patescibacteria group bacterium]
MGIIQKANHKESSGNSREDERAGDIILNSFQDKLHKPVLLKEVLEYLNPKPREKFIDCTIGLGGHSFEIIKRGGEVLGIDQDEESLRNLKSVNGLILKHGNFVDLKKLAGDFSPDGILLDLGISSWQLEKSKRGISFQKTEPLDMRMNLNNSLTAREIVNDWAQEELERIFYEYGEERFSRRIARKIIEERKRKKIETTYELVGLIIRAYPHRKIRRIHPATKVFQALRIAVNNELENLKKTLPQALEILKLNGRLVVISFHSLEDKIVKNFFRDEAKNNKLKILTKKPIVPTIEEIKINHRSRSAKLRACIKI